MLKEHISNWRGRTSGYVNDRLLPISTIRV